MRSSTKSMRGVAFVKFIFVLAAAVFLSGCAVPLSKKTCSSLQGVSMRIMSDRQAGMTKEAAVTKLAAFTSGKPDSRHFFDVASQIIEAAYQEPVGKSGPEKALITQSFVSRMDDRCLSGELGPSYNPVPRIAPAIH